MKIATPISNLFDNPQSVILIQKNSDCLECRDRSFNALYSKQEVFHCELQLIHKWSEEKFEYIKQIKENKKELRLISFHLASCCDNPSIKDGRFVLGGEVYSGKEMLKNSRINLLRIKEIFKENIKLAVENNNFFPTGAYEFVTNPEFIAEIVYENEINFLFDIGHAKISAFNHKIDFNNYFQKLPLNRMIQIHISKPSLNNENEMIDSHELPDSQDILEAEEIINKYDVEYNTIEYYKNTIKLVNILKQIKNNYDFKRTI